MGRADIATLPALSHGVRLCLHPRALVGSACDGPLVWHTRGFLSKAVTIRRNGLRPLRDFRASREAISLRHSSARSVVTGSQRNGRTSYTESVSGIRDVKLTLGFRLKGRFCVDEGMTRRIIVGLLIFLALILLMVFLSWFVEPIHP